MRIMILEDNEDRRQVMRAALAGKFPSFAIEFFAAAQPMIERFKTAGLYDVALASLDHDLEMIQTSEGTTSDPGTGVDVAAWLATQPAVFPVIVHTTSAAGEQMMDLLIRPGWTVSRVVPFSGEEWITGEWYPLARRQIVTHAPRVSMAAFGLQILKSCWQSGNRVENLLGEAVRAAYCLITGAPEPASFSIQLLFLDSADRLMPLVPEHDFFPGNFNELVEEVGEIEAAAVTDPRLAKYRQSLESLEIRALQITILHIAAPEAMHAVMIVAAKSDQFPLESHRVQTVLAELRILIDVALLVEFQKSAGKHTRTLKRKA